MKRSKFVRFLISFSLVIATVFTLHNVVPSLYKNFVSAAEPVVTIYKAPTASKVQRIMKSGFLAADFVCDPNDEGANGMCYFAGPKDRSVAEKYNSFYKSGIIEVAIDQKTYTDKFKSLEHVYDNQGPKGTPRYELVVPPSLFPTLNTFPRQLKSN